MLNFVTELRIQRKSFLRLLQDTKKLYCLVYYTKTYESDCPPPPIPRRKKNEQVMLMFAVGELTHEGGFGCLFMLQGENGAHVTMEQ